MGDTLLVQSWKDPISDEATSVIRLADDISAALNTPLPLKIFLSHRGRGINAKSKSADSTYAELKAAIGERWGGGTNSTMREGNLTFLTLLAPARDPGLHLVCWGRRVGHLS